MKQIKKEENFASLFAFIIVRSQGENGFAVEKFAFALIILVRVGFQREGEGRLLVLK